jgi:hypothetical protein
MWTKDGKIYKGDGIIAADGKWHSTPTPEMFTNAGWEWVEPPAPEPEPKRYSKLKVIRALGENWAAKKAELEAAGLLDQFMAAQNLAEDDPAFAAVLATLTEAEREALTGCEYE